MEDVPIYLLASKQLVVLVRLRKLIELKLEIEVLLKYLVVRVIMGLLEAVCRLVDRELLTVDLRGLWLLH